jgi:hypothetical protein
MDGVRIRKAVLTFDQNSLGASGMFAADLSDGIAAAMAAIGSGIGLAIWFGWPIAGQGAAILLPLLPALELF